MMCAVQEICEQAANEEHRLQEEASGAVGDASRNWSSGEDGGSPFEEDRGYEQDTGYLRVSSESMLRIISPKLDSTLPIQFKKSFVSPSLIEYPLREGPHSSLYI